LHWKWSYNVTNHVSTLPTVESFEQLMKRMLLCFLTNKVLLVRTAAERSLITPQISDSALLRFFDNNNPRCEDARSRRPAVTEFHMSGQPVPILLADAPLRVVMSWLDQNRGTRFGIIIEKRSSFGRRLPEAVYDRCAMSTNFDLPVDSIFGVLNDIGRRYSLSPASSLGQEISDVSATVSAEMLKKVFSTIDTTRPDHPAFDIGAVLKGKIQCGLSPRALIDVEQLAVAHAVVHGRPQMRNEDVVSIFPSAAEHRIILTEEAEREQFDLVPALTQHARAVMFA
jgi:AAA lid domain